MECSTAWVVYGSSAAEAENSVPTDEHRRAVAEVFAQMAEIEIIALERQLKTSQEGLVYLLNPTTNTPVPIGLMDIERREKQCRNERRPPAVTPAASYYGPISSSYENIDDYNQEKQVQMRQLNVRSNGRRRCFIATATASLCLLVVAAVVVAVLLLTGPNNKVSCGDVQFSCSDGQTCVASSKRCDGNNDCGDSSDETNCPTTATITTTPTPVEQRCILVIGGLYVDNSTLIEYYHPTMDECDTNAIGMMSIDKIEITYYTSGCYLSDTQQVVIREGVLSKPPMLYGLRDATAKALSIPAIGYIKGSTSSSISSTKCLSCGGWSGNKLFKECFQFNSSSPTEWSEIPSLSRPVSHSASVSMGTENSYYIIGGFHEDYSASKQVFRYSVDERQWYNETSMAQGRTHHSAAALSATEFIVCGGSSSRSDCEVYNTTQKEWRRVGNLITGRQFFATASFNGTVYAIGGESTDLARLDSVEAYDQRTEKWTEVKKLKYGRQSFVSIVV